MNAFQKHVLVLAHQVLETTDDYKLMDQWTDDDWRMFQSARYANSTAEEIQAVKSLLRPDGSPDPEKIRAFGHDVIFNPGAQNPIGSMEDAARRIIADSQNKTGVFEPLWLKILRRVTGRVHN